MPGVDRVVVLDAGICAGPGRVPNGFPQIARLDRLGDRAVGAADQLPVVIILDGAEEGIRNANRVVGVLTRDRGIGFAVPIRVVGREFDAGVALLGVVQHALDVGFGDRGFLGLADCPFQRVVLGGIISALGGAVPGADRLEDRVQATLVHLGAGDDGGDLLLLLHLPVDVLLDIGVIRIDDDHLGRAPCRPTGFDRARSPVADLEETHEARGFATPRKRLIRAAQRGEVGAGARAILEQPRLTHPKVHDAAVAHQIVADGLDETSVRLGVFVGGLRFRQLAGDVIDVVMPLAGTVDAIGPMQAGIEPLGRVGRSALCREHVPHLVKIGGGVLFGGKITAFPAPVSPGAGQTIKDLAGGGFPPGLCVTVGYRAPKEFRYVLLTYFFHLRGHAGLAKVFLRDHIAGDLAPARRDFAIVQLEHDGTVRIADLGGGGDEIDALVSILSGFGKFALDLHSETAPDRFMLAS